MAIEKRVCELFAGVGGFHLGLSRAGEWEVVWANQWEPSRIRQDAFDCYRSNFPNTRITNIDIAEINNNPDIYQIPQYNLLVGGFPCQDYSVASTGAQGIEGKKGVLWWEIEKILRRNRPPFVLLENVDRLLKSPVSQRGRDFGVMLACLRDLGYSVEWRVINAADYGFPQRRRRTFIFAFHKTTLYYQNFIRNKEKIGIENLVQRVGFFSDGFPIKEINLTNMTKLNGKVLNVSNNFEFQFLESGLLLGRDIVTQRYVPEYEESKTLRNVLEQNVDEQYYLGENLEQWIYMKGAKAEPRRSNTGHEYIYREGALSFPDNIDLPSRTMLTSESSKNRSTHVVSDLLTNRLRVLTPVECERLNGFDDNWTNTGMSLKFRYFCMGNALVVGLIERMGGTLNRIFEEEPRIENRL
ncbi:DNA (cytosine-5-)-methyltransferase [Clostridium botulinum]|nr:DNA (cytosine-5-)-methyltransferase [Clostridium botulinum]